MAIHFEGGERLKLELKSRQRKWAPRSVEVGFFEPEAASLAFFMEFGFINKLTGVPVPPRPFFRMCILDKKLEWGASLAGQLADGKTSLAAMKQIGKWMRDDVSAYMTFDWMYIRNRPATIKRKGFDKPLYETGRLHKKVKFKVVTP